MADEQQDTSEQSNQQADDTAHVSEEGTPHNVDNPEETEDKGNTQAGKGIDLQDGDKLGEQAIEQDKTDELEGSNPDGDIKDPNVDQAQSSQEQTDHQEKQALNGNDLPDQDAASASSNENISPPDQDSNHDQPNQDIPASQDFTDGSPAVKNPIEDSTGSQTNLVENPGEGDMARESEETAKDQLEDGEADAAFLQPEPDQPEENIDNATEGMKVPDEGTSTNEQNQNVDNEEPTGDTVQSNNDSSNVDPKETEEAALPSDAPDNGESPHQDTVHESPSSNQDDQALTVGTPGSPSQINNDLNQGPISEAVNVNSPSSSESPSQKSPSPAKEQPTSTESTPTSLQQNNNNELHQGDDFGQFGSVHIPTAGVGDVDEVNGESGLQYDLRDPAMHEMRSSLPVDAYGDSRSHPLPAIHRDPRLSRSLPPSTDPANIPEGYHNRSLSLGEGKQSRTHIPRIPSASGSSNAGAREGDVRRALNSAKLPPSVMKMSTVMVSARKRAVLNRHSSVFYEERHQTKVISLDEAINSRPPMPFDLDNPGPWSYSPKNKPLNETNAPEFTFGHRLREKGGGGRTANSKTWFNSKDGFTTKVHWDKRWPSPAHYNSTRPLLGRRKPTMFDYPNFSIAVKSKFSISKRGSENEPAPNEYNRSKSDAIILRKAPSYTISQRHQDTQLWSGKEMTPGPSTYTPRWGFNSGMIHHPSFTIQGVRRTKNHQLGPHSTF